MSGEYYLCTFDSILKKTLRRNMPASLYSRVHQESMTDLQKAGCNIFASGLSISLSIRELVRHAMLHGACILIRPLLERLAIISFLYKKPESIVIWNNGWKYDERPSLKIIFKYIFDDKVQDSLSQDVISLYNNIVHGDPNSTPYNIYTSDVTGLSFYSVGKITDNDSLCDFICNYSWMYTFILWVRLTQIFPDTMDIKY